MTPVAQLEPFELHSGEFEIRAEPDEGVFLTSSERWEGVRVRWRRVGERRFRTFVIVADDGQSLETIADLVPEAVALRAAERSA